MQSGKCIGRTPGIGFKRIVRKKAAGLSLFSHNLSGKLRLKVVYQSALFACD